ncbi:Nucleotide-diphospho-sugar transferase protein [Actinidia chinensis var. chinensis]|uniref:Glycosyltransferase n=1 Tax=Actinidia chinensis var. chinensis TaxID=1590841 RepID=A0A2R6RE54_ACTCC|nr:Nucleotide-diphospho-sugar transferase protein [Actinidia chinensis var. chinensis]
MPSNSPSPHGRLPFHLRRSPAETPRSLAGNFLSDMLSDSSFSTFLRRSIVLVCFFLAVSLSCFVLFKASHTAGLRIAEPFDPFSRLRNVVPSVSDTAGSEEFKLERVLQNAAMKDGTVILTTLNEAWAAPNSIIDLFLESFRIGYGTRKLLNHLMIIALDERAFSRCQVLHNHCFALLTEGVNFSKEAYFMTPDYLKMMWRRIDFLRSVLEMGYNFVFTDADIMWFRNPFPRFYLDADFQIACDHFVGNSYDLENKPNGGFNFVRSNNRTIEFYKFWYSSREVYPGYHDQDVLNIIKFDAFIIDLELKMRFLNTANFGGFCEPSKDLNRVCTMHANCCFGLGNKLHDLRVTLDDWKRYLSLPPSLKKSSISSWRVPQNCSLDLIHHYNSTQKSVEQAKED